MTRRPVRDPAPPPLRERATPEARISFLTVVIAATGVALVPLHADWWGQQDLPLHLTWWMLAPAFALAEIFAVHYQFRRENYSFTLSDVPLALGLFFAAPAALLAARLVGGGLALRLHRRQGPRKLAFNLACNVLETALDVWLFRMIAGHRDGQSGRVITAGVVAIIAGVIVVTGCIALAISIQEGRLTLRGAVRLLSANLVVAVNNVSLAMAAVAVLWVSRIAGVLLLCVVAILFVAYRSYARLQQKHDDLELLYDFTRRTGQALDLDSAMRELLAHVGSVLRAGVVELVLQAERPDGTLVRTRLVDGSVDIATVGEDTLWQRILSDGQSIFAPESVRDHAIQIALHEHGVDDAMVGPLRGNDGSVIGMLLVGDRLGAASTFTIDDFKLFEALVNHASVSLENRHLIDRLRREAADKEYQALHDALTGLPNRLLFQDRIDRALASVDEGKVAVLLLDLDRFKEVNDTLGHHNGDLLLQEIGVRLRRIMRAGDTVARLGGDEFAVLLTSISGEEAALAAAEGFRHALARPFAIADVNLDVGCGVGIALSPDHGDDATVLLQRADVAMYSAKANQTGVEVYDSARDTYSLERLALVGELREAIEGGGLSVYYQPKADVQTGEVRGLEALIRWEHPRQGFVAPEEIIGVAEQTGLIRPLTLWVLDEALRQCARWHRDGHDFTMAVNLSIRNLLDPELPNDVLRLLREYELPASALIFEITENSIMSDPGHTIDVLDRLRSIGIRLAIDDFGTGYSSFSHLQRMPLDEIKIDKSFVQHLAHDQNDLVIVRSIVDLGRNLGLKVVAEGVEDDGAWARLAELGADMVQGFVLTAPLAADELDAWIGGYEPALGEMTGDVVPLRTPSFRRT
jgi:diguanylate cyclase (GGDEF)-like protein